jgi:hypothetical protein
MSQFFNLSLDVGTVFFHNFFPKFVKDVFGNLHWFFGNFLGGICIALGLL